MFRPARATTHFDDLRDPDGSPAGYGRGPARDRSLDQLGAEEIRSRIDRIDAEVTGCVRTNAVFRHVCRNRYTAALAFATRLALDDTHPAHVSLGASTANRPPSAVWNPRVRYPLLAITNHPANVIADNRRRKHLTGDVNPTIEGAGAVAVRYLAESCGLFERAYGTHDAFARAFMVPKSDGKLLRMICDGREANSMWNTDAFPSYTLPTIESIRQVIANAASGAQSKREPFYVASTDWRNAFFQVPLPRRLRRYCVHKLGRHDFVWPTTLPMGLKISPFIMSALSWATVLYTRDGKLLPGIDASTLSLPRDSSDVNDPAWQTFPTWLPLHGGGGIFVIIDNIFVVSPRRDVVERILGNIFDNAYAWRLAFKLKRYTRSATGYEGYFPKDAESFAALRSTVLSECFHVMDCDNAEGAVFCGVRWFYDGYRLDAPNDSERDALDPFLSAGHWKSTYRQLMSFMGLVAWHRRVLFEDPLDDPLGAHLHELHRRAVPSTPACKQAWKEIVEVREAKLLNALREAWSDRWRATKCAYHAQNADYAWRLLLATDASSGSGDCPGFLSAVVMNEFGRVHMPMRWPFPRGFSASSPIAHLELLAVIYGVGLCQRLMEGRGRGLVTLACDNQNCLAWLGARRHFGATVSAMLRRLRELLDGTRLFGVYVRSASNVADPYSRDVSDSEAPDPALLTQSRNVLLPAQAAAHALFRVSGAATGCLRRARPCDTTLL
jgi:hypothetical protein